MTTATPTEHRFQLTMGAPLVANAGWLSFVRIFFSLYLLAFAQTRSAASIATLPDAYFNPPVGPLMVLSSAPSSIFLVLLQVLVTVGLILLLVGYRTALVSYSLPVVLIFLAGIRFSTGKIDHDILIYLLPLFLARAWGSQLAVRSERFAAPRLDILALFLGFFFLSSGVIKAASGWLDWDYSATASWLDFYRTNYGAETALSGFLSGVPAFMLELLDWATVLLECSILPLLLFKRTTALAVLLCLFFNVAVIFLFGIDFAELFPVYLALLPFALHTVKELRTTGVAGLAFVTVLAASWNSMTGGVVTLGPFATSGSIFWVFSIGVGCLAGYATWKTLWSTSGFVVSRKIGSVVISALSIPLLLTLVWTEPYPAVIGPGFRGGISGDLKQTWTKDGEEVGPKAIFDGSPYSQNIGFFGWPSPEGQGHEFRQWHGNGELELPAGVTVEWVRVR